MSNPQKAQERGRRKNGRLRDNPRSQVLDLQRDELLSAGVSERHLYSDTASGKNDDRSGLAACLQALRQGDTLVVWKLDRLGRSLRHLVNTVHDLTSRGVGLRVLTGQGAAHNHPCGQVGLRYLRFARRMPSMPNAALCSHRMMVMSI
jgi:DNA invertase Pin-like site-specific DNA recombinase